LESVSGADLPSRAALRQEPSFRRTVLGLSRWNPGGTRGLSKKPKGDEKWLD
jgi:hypothetical protein